MFASGFSRVACPRTSAGISIIALSDEHGDWRFAASLAWALRGRAACEFERTVEPPTGERVVKRGQRCGGRKSPGFRDRVSPRSRHKPAASSARFRPAPDPVLHSLVVFFHRTIDLQDDREQAVPLQTSAAMSLERVLIGQFTQHRVGCTGRYSPALKQRCWIASEIAAGVASRCRVLRPTLLQRSHRGPSLVSGGVKPRINGEQRASEATRCRAGHQEVASRQAASRLLRCAPALRVTCHNLLIRLAFRNGRKPASGRHRPVCENTPFQDVNPYILCSPDFGAFAQPSTSRS